MENVVEKDAIFDETHFRIQQIADEMEEFSSLLAGQPVEERLSNLRSTVDHIGLTPARRPPRLERYLEQWEQFKNGKVKDFDKGTKAYLCWEPAVATDMTFLCHLIATKFTFTRRPLTGLLRSCHEVWSDAFGASLPADIVRGLFCRYNGPSPVILKWQRDLELILGKDAITLLARKMIEENHRMRTFFDEWFLEPASPLVQMTVERASEMCRKRLAKPSKGTVEFLFGQLLPWPGWEPSAFRKQIGLLIMDGAATGQIREILQRFILAHKELGDPRVPANKPKWAQMGEGPTIRVIRWLGKTPFTYVEQVYREGHGWSWQQRGERWAAGGPAS